MSNTGETIISSDEGVTFRSGQSFTTGNNSGGYSLSSVDLRLFSNPGNGTVVVIRRNNTMNNPGDLVATLTNPASFTGGALNTFTAPANTQLTANTTYWLVVNDSGNNKVSFASTTSTNDTGETNWSLGDKIKIFVIGNWGSSTFNMLIAVKGIVLPLLTITPSASSVTEGTSASFTVSNSPAPSSALPVDLTVAEAAGSNFVASRDEGSKSITIPTSGSVTYAVATVDDGIDEPNGSVAVTVNNGSSYTLGIPSSASVMVEDNDPTIVTLARTGSNSTVDEGSTVAFTVTLGRALIAGEIIDVPMTVGGSVTTTDWSLARKPDSNLNTEVTLVDSSTVAPIVRFTGAGAQTATLILTAVADNTAERGDPEMLTLALGPNNATANGFDLNTRMTNVGGGADPDGTKNTFSVTINDIDSDKVPPTPAPLKAIAEQCKLTRADLPVPTATDNRPGMVIVTSNITTFPITSNTTITWTYTDAAGNTATQTQQVTIDDTMAPIPAAADLPTLEDCSQITSLIAPTAIDNCDGTITAATNASPPITASTTITWTYTDGAGNMITQTQQVTIGDTEAPIPDNSDLPTLTGICPVATLADLTAPTATDNCDAGTITAITDASFPITQSTTITWTYTDAAGNTATQTQEVICPLSAAEDAEEAVIFPNPSGRYLEVRSSTGGVFKILSLSGKPLLQGNTNTRIDTSSLQSGLYLIQLPDGRLLKFVRE